MGKPRTAESYRSTDMVASNPGDDHFKPLRKDVTMETIDVRYDPNTQHSVHLPGDSVSRISVPVYRTEDEIDRMWAYNLITGKCRLQKGIE